MQAKPDIKSYAAAPAQYLLRAWEIKTLLIGNRQHEITGRGLGFIKAGSGPKRVRWGIRPGILTCRRRHMRLYRKARIGGKSYRGAR
jgi:hypothetical protein